MISKQCAVALFVPSLGLLAVGCTTNDSTPAAEDAICVPVSESDGPGWEITARTLSREGRELTYERRAVALGDDGSSLLAETSIEADGERIMLIAEESSPGRYEINIDYGALVPGLTMATAAVQDHVLSGSVNGRAIEPVRLEQADATTARFEDGNPEPEPGIHPDIEDALPSLFEAASSAAQKCVGMNGMAEAQPAVVDKRGDRGHVSQPASSSYCLECIGACVAEESACNADALRQCAAAVIVPWAYATCVAVEESYCADEYRSWIDVCNEIPGPCCPVVCGGGCCEGGETCISPAERLCCGPDQHHCAQECCDSAEVCVGGTCCDPVNRCRDACCNPTDSCLPRVSLCCSADQTPCVDKCCNTAGCIDTASPPTQCETPECIDNDLPNTGICCEPENICGTSCCGELDSCIRSLSLCCGFATPACGTRCCRAGETCTGGNCCPNERLCAGTCCAPGSGCDLPNKTCKSCTQSNMKFCSKAGTCCPITEVCTDFPDICCPTGQVWCTTVFPERCTTGSECIN